jgi:serine/threonine protein kinase
MKRLVALKVISPALLDSPVSLKRFQREVETIAQLNHPNIVLAHDADEADGIRFLVMELVEGRDLSSLIRASGPLPVGQAVDCIIQAATGLAYAHRQGVVHRDVKPSNMLLDRNGVVKILDLGLAGLICDELDARGDRSLTGSEMIVGTFEYLPPEQAQSHKLRDPRSDIYSLGLTLWFLLTGRVAYEADSAVSMLLAHRERPIPSLVDVHPDVPPALDAIFCRMAAKQMSDRFQSMNEVVADLESLQLSDIELPRAEIVADRDTIAIGRHVVKTTAVDDADHIGDGAANPARPSSGNVLIPSELMTGIAAHASPIIRQGVTRPLRKSSHVSAPSTRSIHLPMSAGAHAWWRNHWLALASAGLLISGLSLAATIPRLGIGPGIINNHTSVDDATRDKAQALAASQGIGNIGREEDTGDDRLPVVAEPTAVEQIKIRPPRPAVGGISDGGESLHRNRSALGH